eukprot:symbB.v1.2.027706.t1/scaffold2863.1/size68590/9
MMNTYKDGLNQEQASAASGRNTEEAEKMPSNVSLPLGNKHSFHQETKGMGMVRPDFRQFTKVGYEGRLSVVSESQVHQDGLHRYVVQFTAGELSRADGVGFVFSQRLPCAKNIQRIVSIFVNQRGRICMRAFSEIERLVERSLHLQRLAGVVRGELASDYGELPGKRPVSTAEFSFGSRMAALRLCGETQPEAAEQSSFKQSTKEIKGNIIARNACSMESWKIRRYITEPWSKHFSGLKFWSSKVKLHADQGFKMATHWKVNQGAGRRKTIAAPVNAEASFKLGRARSFRRSKSISSGHEQGQAKDRLELSGSASASPANGEDARLNEILNDFERELKSHSRRLTRLQTPPKWANFRFHLVVAMGCGASAKKDGSGSGKKSTTGFASASLIVDNQGKIQQFYDIDKKKIGEGSYGSVCKARNKATKAMRAIKTINKAALKSPEAFKKEIQIMKILDHPNICKLYESFQDHRYIYLVLELCTGGELFDRIIEYGHLTEKQAALLMQNMFRAIYYMHQCQYTHRDLKPENFIFTTKEAIEKSVLKLIDFGLAREFAPDQVLTTKAGTPYYVAPQVLAGKYDHMADMWSLGVIMYVMLCGYPPFYGESDQEVLDEVRQGKVKFQAADWKNVSEDAKALIKNLLQMSPKDRYTAEQALNDVWIKEKAPKAKDVNLQDGFVDKLRGFLSQNKLKKAALQVIASSLDDKQIQALRETFQALDENGDGLLTAAELKAGLEKGGLKDIPGDLQEILKAIDADGSGVIDYTEFLAATLDRKHFIEEDACWQAFRVFDRDGNGSISQKELAEVLASDDVAGKFHKDLADLMKMVDTNGDGEIDFQEFMQMMRS